MFCSILHLLGVIVLLLFVDGGARLTARADGATRRGLLLLDHPVEDEVVLVAHAIEQVLEELTQVADVGLLFEFERATVIQIDGELLRQALR